MDRQKASAYVCLTQQNMEEMYMSIKYKNLFSPYNIGKVKVKNRYAVAPMGGAKFTALGTYDPDTVDFYVDCAKGGFGLIFSNSLATDLEVDPNSPLDRLFPNYNPKAFIANCVFMNERIHSYNARIFCQITMGPGRNGGGKLAPSELPYYFAPDEKSRALTTEEVKAKISSLIRGAKIAKDAGFDGVDIHAMHWGYLIDEFAMEMMNHRTDEYGGSFENRMRVPKEIVEGIKKECGSDFPVTIRVSLKGYIKDFNVGSYTGEGEAGRTLEEAVQICRTLESYGYDGLSVDVGTYESFYHACPPSYIPKGNYIDLAEEAKKAVNIPILLAGRMNDPQMCEKALEEGKIDGIVLGRAALADPHYAAKLEKGQEERIRPCLSCNQGCIGREFLNGAVSCAVNPSVLRRESYGIRKADEPKKVMVVGGGVAGMEAARTLFMRGHEVALYEASDHLGGNLLPAGAHTFKAPVLELNDWYKRELKELGVEVYLNTRVSADFIEQSGADAVIIAIGSLPVMPPIPGIEQSISSIQALSKGTRIGDKVIVIGGGLVGCELAIEYGMEGKEVTVVEALPKILSSGAPVPFMNKMCIEEMMDYYKIKVKTGSRVSRITETGAVIAVDGEEEELTADTVVMAIGFRPVPSFADEVRGCGMDVYEIGDGRKVGSVMTSVWDAYEIARSI